MDVCGWKPDWNWDWGTVPDWVAGVGTVGALLWAVKVYRSSVRQQRFLQSRLVHAYFEEFDLWEYAGLHNGRSESIDRDRMQTGLLKPPNLQFPGDWEPTEDVHVALMYVQNNSDEIITSVDGGAVSTRPGVPNLYFLPIHAIAPGEKAERVVLVPYPGVSASVVPYEPFVSFRDSGGVWWFRRSTEPVKGPYYKPRRRRDFYRSVFGLGKVPTP